jgi:hypothetical protein
VLFRSGVPQFDTGGDSNKRSFFENYLEANAPTKFWTPRKTSAPFTDAEIRNNRSRYERYVARATSAPSADAAERYAEEEYEADPKSTSVAEARKMILDGDYVPDSDLIEAFKIASPAERTIIMDKMYTAAIESKKDAIESEEGTTGVTVGDVQRDISGGKPKPSSEIKISKDGTMCIDGNCSGSSGSERKGNVPGKDADTDAKGDELVKQPPLTDFSLRNVIRSKLNWRGLPWTKQENKHGRSPALKSAEFWHSRTPGTGMEEEISEEKDMFRAYDADRIENDRLDRIPTKKKGREGKPGIKPFLDLRKNKRRREDAEEAYAYKARIEAQEKAAKEEWKKAADNVGIPSVGYDDGYEGYIANLPEQGPHEIDYDADYGQDYEQMTTDEYLMDSPRLPEEDLGPYAPIYKQQIPYGYGLDQSGDVWADETGYVEPPSAAADRYSRNLRMGYGNRYGGDTPFMLHGGNPQYAMYHDLPEEEYNRAVGYDAPVMNIGGNPWAKQHSGSIYEDGGEYDLNPDEIEEILRNGGQVEYI